MGGSAYNNAPECNTHVTTFKTGKWQAYWSSENVAKELSVKRGVLGPNYFNEICQYFKKSVQNNKSDVNPLLFDEDFSFAAGGVLYDLFHTAGNIFDLVIQFLVGKSSNQSDKVGTITEKEREAWQATCRWRQNNKVPGGLVEYFSSEDKAKRQKISVRGWHADEKKKFYAEKGDRGISQDVWQAQCRQKHAANVPAGNDVWVMYQDANKEKKKRNGVWLVEVVVKTHFAINYGALNRRKYIQIASELFKKYPVTQGMDYNILRVFLWKPGAYSGSLKTADKGNCLRGPLCDVLALALDEEWKNNPLLKEGVTRLGSVMHKLTSRDLVCNQETLDSLELDVIETVSILYLTFPPNMWTSSQVYNLVYCVKQMRNVGPLQFFTCSWVERAIKAIVKHPLGSLYPEKSMCKFYLIARNAESALRVYLQDPGVLGNGQCCEVSSATLRYGTHGEGRSQRTARLNVDPERFEGKIPYSPDCGCGEGKLARIEAVIYQRKQNTQCRRRELDVAQRKLLCEMWFLFEVTVEEQAAWQRCCRQGQAETISSICKEATASNNTAPYWMASRNLELVFPTIPRVASSYHSVVLGEDIDKKPGETFRYQCAWSCFKQPIDSHSSARNADWPDHTMTSKTNGDPARSMNCGIWWDFDDGDGIQRNFGFVLNIFVLEWPDNTGTFRNTKLCDLAMEVIWFENEKIERERKSIFFKSHQKVPTRREMQPFHVFGGCTSGQWIGFYDAECKAWRGTMVR